MDAITFLGLARDRQLWQIFSILEGAADGTTPLSVDAGGGGGNVAQGALRTTPSGSEAGMALDGMPTKTSGVRFYIEEGAYVEFFVEDKDYSSESAPATVVQVGPFDEPYIHDEPLSAFENIFVTNGYLVSKYRWIQR